MAIIPWPDRVRRGGELKLFPKDTFKGTRWATDLDAAITTMNQLLSDKSISLVFKRVDSTNGAHITAEAVPGNGLHGQTTLDRRGMVSTSTSIGRTSKFPRRHGSMALLKALKSGGPFASGFSFTNSFTASGLRTTSTQVTTFSSNRW